MNNKITTALIAMPLLLCGCIDNDGGGGPQATPVDPAPVLSLRSSDQCGCQAAKEIVAENRANNAQSLSFTMLREQIDINRSCVVSFNEDLPARSTRSFGCSVGDINQEVLSTCPGFSPSNASCTVTQIPQVLAVDDDTPPVSCLSACGVGTFNAEICTKINSAVSRPEYRGRIDQITSLFQTNEGEIPKSGYMALFDDQDDDGCNRQNVLLGDPSAAGETLFENYGDTGNSLLECTISGLSPKLGQMKIIIPSLLQGLLAPNSVDSSEFSMTFSRPETSPSMVFGSSVLDAIYGGDVSEIHWQNNRIIVGVGNTCLASDL